MKLPTPPGNYDPAYESQRNLFIEQADTQNHKRLTDIEVVLPQRLILRSPNGTRYVISVSNSGVLSATAL
jgi:hypothetical protein